MKTFDKVMKFYNFFWMLESHYEQRLAWEDAANARRARDQAEASARQQLQAMMNANPSGQLGRSNLNDRDALRESGLL